MEKFFPAGGISSKIKKTSDRKLLLRDDEEFQEEDVCEEVMKETKSSECAACHQSLAKTHQKSSAPIRIPEWPMIQNPLNSSAYNNGYYFEDSDEDDSEELIPPHEIIARRINIARSQVVSFSMFEGIGRTLKGRDLRTLRNAILTMTGFLE